MTDQLGTPKHSLYIGHADAVAIGDSAKAETDASPPSLPPYEELLTLMHEASSELRTYPGCIAGIHIDRPEVDEIVQWAQKSESDKRLGMLQDLPGGGKTVVMRDVLISLEENGYPVLAIKADWLSGIQTRSDLADRLGLPAPVEECARIMATEGPFVVLFDQLDALSLALSRDQATLDVMLSTMARLRSVENVKIIASCRIFELRNDPRLSAIKMDQRFKLQPLDKPQVHQVLDKIGIDPARLLPEHCELIAIPLHLNIYARIIGEKTPSGTPESFQTLQDLYEVLWQRRIMAVPPEKPSLSTRREAIYRLVHEMQSNRRLSAPVAALDEYPAARRYLEQEGYIRREGGNWLFAHQTLLDYCYARRFIAERKSLHQEILSGPQGLFERSQMVQVLAHLRGVDGTLYLQELNSLLFSDDLRTHLRLLLIAWFGALPDPTADEMRIARQLMRAADDKARFLQAVGGNEGWFDALAREIVPSLLRSDTARDIELVTRYLGTMIEKRTSDVLDHLHPFLGTNSDWDTRIAFCLSHLNHWRSDKALEMLCNLFQRGCAGSRGEHCLFKLARANPAAGCQALRAYLDRQLDDLLAQEKQVTQVSESTPAASDQTDLSSRFHWNRGLFGEYAVRLITGTAAQECPEAVIEHLLPWFIRVAVALTRSVKSDDEYPWEPLFSSGWYNEHLLEGAEFAQHLVQALRWVAHKNPSDFRKIARRLAAVDSMATQRVLAQAYLSNPEMYADDIFEYLTADPRRLNLGEHIGAGPHYDSSRLYGAVFQHVDARRRAILEQLILDFQSEWERRNPQLRGITQLRFLKRIPRELLSEEGRDLLGVLERKFPDFELRPPQGMTVGAVGPPIDSSAQAKMSDEAWLSAMQKYDDSGYQHSEFLKGGVRELASSFSGRVKEEPERFYRLAQRFDESISLFYIDATISGLTESEAPAEWVFNLVRRFASRLEGPFRRNICRSLQGRVEYGIPDDILNLLTKWALNDPDPEPKSWAPPSTNERSNLLDGPYQRGINSNRGVALQTVCRCAMKREPAQVRRVFRLLEEAADDTSTAVRACVIESLGWILNSDSNCALAILKQALDGHSRLLQSPIVHRFLYWTYRDHFASTRSIFETLLINKDNLTRQAGARLACLAAFRHPEAKELADQVMCGDPAMRRGAAQVYARNLERHDLENVCQDRLVRLMHDSDERVRGDVGQCFTHLHAEHLDRLRSFIAEFIDSPALMDGAERLVEYLVPLAADAPNLAMDATERIIEAASNEITNVSGPPFIPEHSLVNLCLTVHTHANDPKKKSRSMDLFEHLLLQGNRYAFQALESWDGNRYPVLTSSRGRDLAPESPKRITIQRKIDVLKGQLEEAIRQAEPEKLARTSTDLANAYRQQPWDRRSHNIEQAIFYYRQALEALSRREQGETPNELAAIQINLASAYRERIDGNSEENLQIAIDYYLEALKTLSRDKMPDKWVAAQTGLATAYLESTQGERIKNLKQAIFRYRQALDILDRNTTPALWGRIQANLGTAYREISKMENPSDLEDAIRHYEAALDTLDPSDDYSQWAETHAELAIAYRVRIEGKPLRNLESSEAHRYKAIEVFIDFLESTKVEDWSYHVYKVLGLFSKLMDVSLARYHGLVGEDVYLGMLDLSALFRRYSLPFDDRFPIFYLTADNFGEYEPEILRRELQEHVNTSNRRAIFIFDCDKQELTDIKNQITSTAVIKVHAYDIICLSHQDLKEIVTGPDPHEVLRHLILTQADLTRISDYNSSGATSQGMFFGREHELQQICDLITSSDFILVGGRRIGKTSTLKQLERARLPEAGFHAFYHECSFTPTQEDLVQAVTTDKSWFPDPPPEAPSSLAEVIYILPDDKPSVILLDEADKLIENDRTAGYPIFNTLRALSSADRCRFVLCGERALRAERTNPDSPLNNFGSEMLIGRLERHAVTELVSKPMSRLEITLDDESTIIQRIWRFTSGHPSVVQSLCQQLVRKLSQRRDRLLTLKDVEAVVSDSRFLRKDFLDIYWERATVLERLCSLVMAADQDVHTLTRAREVLIDRGIEVTLNQVDEALERLVDLRNILERTDEGYKFAVTAFPEVIAKTARLDDLIALNCETYRLHGDVVPESHRGAK